MNLDMRNCTEFILHLWTIILLQFVNKLSFRVLPRIRLSSRRKTNKRKLYGKVTVAYCKIRMGHVNTFCGENTDIFQS